MQKLRQESEKEPGRKQNMRPLHALGVGASSREGATRFLALLESGTARSVADLFNYKTPTEGLELNRNPIAILQTGFYLFEHIIFTVLTNRSPLFRKRRTDKKLIASVVFVLEPFSEWQSKSNTPAPEGCGL